MDASTSTATTRGGDLRRPLLLQEGDDIDEERAAAILEGWNASVSAFVADDGGEDNRSCYCPSIESVLRLPVLSTTSTVQNSNGVLDVSAMTNDVDNDEADEEEALLIANGGGVATTTTTTITTTTDTPKSTRLAKFCTSTLLPDGDGMLRNDSIVNGESHDEEDEQRQQQQQQDENTRSRLRSRWRLPSIQQPLVEGPFAVKFLKFVLLTLGSIALVRTTVGALGIHDRDTALTLAQIWRYEGGTILRDLLFFFVVGRMHQRTGVDTIEFLCFGLLANLYFESQSLVSWMRHSATPYEMHCLWPWQLWVFASVVVTGTVLLASAHVVVAYQQKRLWILVGEVLVCAGAFVVPVVVATTTTTSGENYAHFHHWFAGWFLGMHASLHHKWWSRATMAYCWGMYVNGIAVYGRDPLLTCEYVYFLARDQNCPLLGNAIPTIEQRFIGGALSDAAAPDWRNCSSSGYHP